MFDFYIPKNVYYFYGGDKYRFRHFKFKML